jgi:hypothetical protein
MIKHYTAYIIIAYITFDFLAFLWWSTSGQAEPDGFYIGQLTATLIKIII